MCKCKTAVSPLPGSCDRFGLKLGPFDATGLCRGQDSTTAQSGCGQRDHSHVILGSLHCELLHWLCEEHEDCRLPRPGSGSGGGISALMLAAWAWLRPYLVGWVVVVVVVVMGWE